MFLTNPISLLFVAAGVFVVLRLLLRGTTLLYLLKKWWRSIDDRFHVYQFYKVPEYNQSFEENQLYRKISTYLSSLASIEESDFANLFAGQKSNDIVLYLDSNQTVHDTFLGARVSWKNEMRNDGTNNSRTFVLKIRKRDKRRILRPYLQHIHSVTEDIEQRRKEVKLYMKTETDDRYGGGRWKSVPFTHPSTFDTVAMDSDLKNKVKSDLESFLKSKQYYHRLGRVWKRSYLLYGPSGTGKSSFVAAMAKFLCYDLYDVDLSKVSDDSDLKMLLLQTTSRSVIVVEDLDRFLDEKLTAVSLSGVLNFMDGIFSCCGEERIMVFTMTSTEHIDPAIMRPGRIDVHIHFPLCDFSAFKNLANSYLGLKDHKLFPQVEEIFQGGATLSPAEVGEIMIMNRNSPNRALKSVINALQTNVDVRRGCSGKQGQRFSESASGRSRDEPRDSISGGGSGVICRESVHTVREFRKLYGLLRRSTRKSGTFNLSSGEKEKEEDGGRLTI
ncbi:hypothetical protein NE237_014095 [Protea cynaroides]|uniref:AAA+ ATPase domain-containing protein n=1 Tax=Protea cynaroides TaxID=273540 RepID=A0A9Q0H479_9MAGN|nr:hypothetical protein NE237_014095 [Protea cynaroides]